jgi:hypothetical protein
MLGFVAELEEPLFRLAQVDAGARRSEIGRKPSKVLLFRRRWRTRIALGQLH